MLMSRTYPHVAGGGQNGAMDAQPRPVAALVVVDAQNELLDGETAVPSAAEVTERIAALLAAARAAGALVVHVQNDGEPGSKYAPGTHGWAIHDSGRVRQARCGAHS
jgi:nicotinamidase-related amidase